MKKIYLLLMIVTFTFILSACSNNNSTEDTDTGKIKTLTCTINSADEDDYNTDYSIIYTFKNGIIKKLESAAVMETDPDQIDYIISSAEAVIDQIGSYDGFTYQITKEDKSHIRCEVQIDYTKINAEDLTNQYGEDYVTSDTYLKYLLMTMEDIEEGMTGDGYTCK